MIAEADQLTIDEPFTLERPPEPHVYAAACDWVVEKLGQPPIKESWCLVVGSPPFEADDLSRVGWNVILSDCRELPHRLRNWRSRPWAFWKGDTASISDGILHTSWGGFDAISSTCVLCHVGLGRYGDPVCEDGDRKALKEFARVLKPGGKAAVCFGPYLPNLAKTIVDGRNHRIYADADVSDKVSNAGLKWVDMAVWDSMEKRYLAPAEVHMRSQDVPAVGTTIICCYLMTLLEKV